MNQLGTIELVYKQILLRKFRPEDAKELYNGYVNQKEFLFYANKKPVTLEEENLMLRDLCKNYNETNYYNWVITLKETGEIVGSINLKPNLKNDSVLVSYAIDNRHTGKGYATSAVKAVKDYAFEVLKSHRFEGGCATENIASKRVLEKSGLLKEGILKDYAKLSDGYHDMFWFAEINNKLS